MPSPKSLENFLLHLLSYWVYFKCFTFKVIYSYLYRMAFICWSCWYSTQLKQFRWFLSECELTSLQHHWWGNNIYLYGIKSVTRLWFAIVVILWIPKVVHFQRKYQKSNLFIFILKKVYLWMTVIFQCIKRTEMIWRNRIVKQLRFIQFNSTIHEVDYSSIITYPSYVV